jgi:hypothetical protein
LAAQASPRRMTARVHERIAAGAISAETRSSSPICSGSATARPSGTAPRQALDQATGRAASAGGNIIETGTDSYRLARTRAAQQN